MAMLLLKHKKVIDSLIDRPYHTLTAAAALIAICVGFGLVLLDFDSSTSSPDVDPVAAKMAVENMGRLSLIDPTSFSRPDQSVVTHLHLKLRVDFLNQVLDGYVDLTVERKANDSEVVTLDTRDLKIKDVKSPETGEILTYRLSTPYKTFGSKLEVSLPKNNEPKHVVRIHYATSETSTALQWLQPQQTAGKKHPYMFSQNQAIHARSMLPCQDTPSVKAPFTAEITAPAELVVLMGALRDGVVPNPEDPKQKIHSFKQPVQIPSYLIALVVGALESRVIGPRSFVWSEKELVEAAAYEFEEAEAMIKFGEEVMGPYLWQQYDILVLPPSFPFGGMENPCLTFVTPTLLAGDRSLAGVIAHEIAHSWTGNLVTNKNFEHFWLNEGFTMFAERKIIGRMKGESFRNFQAVIGWRDLEESIKTQGVENPLTCLVVNLTNVDPDDAFSIVPYEKGHSFLFYLEQKVGGAEMFEPFFREYIQEFKYQSIDTDQWKKFFLAYFDKKVPANILKTIAWDTWLYKPGMPPVDIKFDMTLTESSQRLKDRWISTPLDQLKQFTVDDIRLLSSWQICEFLSLLLQADPLPVEKLQVMQSVYDFHKVVNAEIRFRWLRIGIKAHWNDIVEYALKFVKEQGRMKYVRPIYRDLYAWEEARQKAIDCYYATREQMMYVTASMVAKDLNITLTL